MRSRFLVLLCVFSSFIGLRPDPVAAAQRPALPPSEVWARIARGLGLSLDEARPALHQFHLPAGFTYVKYSRWLKRWEPPPTLRETMASILFERKFTESALVDDIVIRGTICDVLGTAFRKGHFPRLSKIEDNLGHRVESSIFAHVTPSHQRYVAMANSIRDELRSLSDLDDVSASAEALRFVWCALPRVSG